MLMKKMEIKTKMQKDYFKTFQELDFWLLRHWTSQNLMRIKILIKVLNRFRPQIQSNTINTISIIFIAV
jgi:hypothetical protein